MYRSRLTCKCKNAAEQDGQQSVGPSQGVLAWRFMAAHLHPFALQSWRAAPHRGWLRCHAGWQASQPAMCPGAQPSWPCDACKTTRFAILPAHLSPRLLSFDTSAGTAHYNAHLLPIIMHDLRTSCSMRPMGKMGARSSAVSGWRVAGLRGGGGGTGRSGTKLQAGSGEGGAGRAGAHHWRASEAEGSVAHASGARAKPKCALRSMPSCPPMWPPSRLLLAANSLVPAAVGASGGICRANSRRGRCTIAGRLAMPAASSLCPIAHHLVGILVSSSSTLVCWPKGPAGLVWEAATRSGRRLAPCSSDRRRRRRQDKGDKPKAARRHSDLTERLESRQLVRSGPALGATGGCIRNRAPATVSLRHRFIGLQLVSGVSHLRRAGLRKPGPLADKCGRGALHVSALLCCCWSAQEDGWLDQLTR